MRRYDHNGIRDDIAAGFRDSVEAEYFEKYCPMKVARARFDAAKADVIDQQVSRQVDAAYEEALASEETVLTYQHT